MSFIRAVLFWLAVAAGAVALSSLTALFDVEATDAGPRTTVWRQA